MTWRRFTRPRRARRRRFRRRRRSVFHGGDDLPLAFEHCGPNYDNHIGYRAEKEFLKWKKKDPVLLYRNRLLKESVITQDVIDSLKEEVLREVNEAIDYARSSPFPEVSRGTEDVYAE